MSSGIEVIFDPIIGIFVGIGELVALTSKGVAALARMTRAEIEREIELAHHRQFEKWKKEEPAWAREKINSTVAEIDAELERLKKAEKECERLLAIASKEHTAAGHTYVLSEERKQVEEELRLIREDIATLEKYRRDFISMMDQYLKDISKTRGYNDILSRPNIRYNLGRVSNYTISKLDKKIDKLDKQISEFCKTINDFTDKLQSGQSGLVTRLSKRLDSLDPTSEESLQEVRNFINEIKAEMRSLEKKLKDASLTKEAREAANEEMRMLQKLLDSLSPIEMLLVKYQIMDAEAEERAVSIYNDCVTVLEDISKMSYISESTRLEIEDQKRKLTVLASDLSGENSVTILTHIKSTLEEIKKEAEISMNRYERFKKAHDEYRELHAKYPKKQIRKIMGDKYADPDAYRFSDSDKVEGIIRLLETTNTVLKENLLTSAVDGIVDYFVERVGNKLIRVKALPNGSKEITYTRPDERNVIYVITVSKDGQVEIGPRGVKLHDGRVLTSREELEKPTKNCKWSQNIKEDFKEIDMDMGLIIDQSEEENARIYKEQEYYQLDSEQETIDFLKKNGWSDAEIRKILYGEDASEEEEIETNRDEEEISQAIAIDPHQK